jgi:hypothetical protein
MEKLRSRGSSAALRPAASELCAALRLNGSRLRQELEGTVSDLFPTNPQVLRLKSG